MANFMEFQRNHGEILLFRNMPIARRLQYRTLYPELLIVTRLTSLKEKHMQVSTPSCNSPLGNNVCHCEEKKKDESKESDCVTNTSLGEKW
nr:PREDICTED: uncharacterized protein LOC105663394 isoform X2 [Megachile rotundata]